MKLKTDYSKADLVRVRAEFAAIVAEVAAEMPACAEKAAPDIGERFICEVQRHVIYEFTTRLQKRTGHT